MSRRGVGGSRRIQIAALGIGLIAVGVCMAVALSGTSRAAETAGRTGTQFSAYIEDLPIMPGLNEEDDGYAFDLFDGGRLAEARLGGEADAAVVRGFYAATLTQLGWRSSETEPYVYTRGRERMIFLVEPRRPKRGTRPQRGLEAVFVITPSPATPAR